MIVLCSLVTLILCILFFSIHEDAAYYKELFNDFVSTNMWTKVDIVEEKSTFEDMMSEDWTVLEQLLAAAAACIVSFTIGWTASNYRSLYEKNNHYEFFEECIKNQCIIEEKIESIEEKINEFEQKYSSKTMDLLYSKLVAATDPSPTKDAFQQMESEGISRSSQTCQRVDRSPSTCEDLTKKSSTTEDPGALADQDSPLPTMEESLTVEDNEGVLLDEEEYSKPLYIGSQSKCNGLTKIIERQNKDSVEVADIVFEGGNCPIEINVEPCLSSDDAKEDSNGNYENDKFNCVCSSDQSKTYEPAYSAVGSGENLEMMPSKTCQGRRIPQFQGLRKCPDNKSREQRDQDSGEDKVIIVSSCNKIPKYSQASDAVETPTRRKKQRGSNAKSYAN